MLAAFSFVELAYLFGFFAILVFAVAYLLGRRRSEDVGGVKTQTHCGPAAPKSGGHPLRNGATAALRSLGIVVFILTAMNITGVWRLLWIANPWLDLNRVVFPDLNGEWEGVLLSNGPLRNEGLDTTQGASRPDCSVFGLGNIEKFGCLRVRVSINMSFFDTSLVLGAGTRSVSHTRSTWLKRRHGGENAKLMYIYEVRQAGSVTKDERTFSGAAELDILQGKTVVLDGAYWTDRNWIDGHNTAGRIRLTRLNP